VRRRRTADATTRRGPLRGLSSAVNL